MRIAIVGTGISGLVCAYRLHRQHELTLFEAADYVGGHTNTVCVDVAGKRHTVDTGFIVHNDWTYPEFCRLLSELNVVTRPTTMGFSVRDDATGIEYCGSSLNALFAQRRNLLRPRFYRLIADILRFNRNAIDQCAECSRTTTVAEFLDRFGYGPGFVRHYLLPMGAAIWSCPTGTFAQFPIGFIIDFYRNHGLLSLSHRPTWRVIEGGSRTYIEKLTAGFRDRIRLRSPVRAVARQTDQVMIRTDRIAETFDHVIFACHSDQALQILGNDAAPIERQILSQFPYSRNFAVLHTDDRVLPTSRRAWASWNYRIDDRRTDAATVTYNMNILQGLQSRKTICVTLNEEAAIDPRQILGRYEYDHPIFTAHREAAQARHAELIDVNRTSYCGAYWRNGFHEDGVVSAMAVVNKLQQNRSIQAIDFQWRDASSPGAADAAFSASGVAR